MSLELLLQFMYLCIPVLNYLEMLSETQTAKHNVSSVMTSRPTFNPQSPLPEYDRDVSCDDSCSW
jgi:hypothetical protein